MNRETGGNAGPAGPLVMKFGGTSVAEADKLRRVAQLVDAGRECGVLVVLSALAGVTDALLGAGRKAAAGDGAAALADLDAIIERHRTVAADLCGPGVPASIERDLAAAVAELGDLLRGASLLGEMPARSLDVLAGRGELLSSAILADFTGATFVDARTVLRTDSRFGQARPCRDATRRLAQERLVPLLGPGAVVVTQGFIGADEAGVPTTLGRGGSDYSASLLGAAVDAREIQIWTDVAGVLTCDPGIVKAARPVPVLGYDEAAELAAFGAKVLHPATILPAIERGIPVTVRNSLSPEGSFTTISREAASGLPVTAIASRGPVTVVTVRTPRMLGGTGFLARIFEVFSRHGVSVDLVATSEVGVSATVDGAVDLSALSSELEAFAELRIERGRAVIALVGESLRRTRGVPARALTALRDTNVEMISMGSNEINLSLVVEAAEAREAMIRLHAAFFENGGAAGDDGDPADANAVAANGGGMR